MLAQRPPQFFTSDCSDTAACHWRGVYGRCQILIFIFPVAWRKKMPKLWPRSFVSVEVYTVASGIDSGASLGWTKLHPVTWNFPVKEVPEKFFID